MGWVFFFTTCFCLSLNSGLFVEGGRVFGFSGFFRSRLIPLGISVENGFLEIVGLDPGSGLILGDFLFYFLKTAALSGWR
jgi:hypothetical protein